MPAPFETAYYTVTIVTPTFVGGSKERDFALGEDYYYDDSKLEYCFVNSRKFQRLLNNRQLSAYSSALARNLPLDAEEILKEVVAEHPDLVYHTSFFPLYGNNAKEKSPYDTIRRHVSDASGHLVIPGSSIKGAIRSVIGRRIMEKTKTTKLERGGEFDRLFGSIDNNLMRLMQVTDVRFNDLETVTPHKIFSGDLYGSYANLDTYGAWKHKQKEGHDTEFRKFGFVTAHQSCTEGGTSNLRVNLGEQLLQLMQQHKKAPANADTLQELTQHGWLEMAKNHMRDYLDREIAFFDAYRNEDFPEAVALLEKLASINETPGAALMRIGAGQGYHSITGGWKYRSHVKTEQAERFGRPIDAIKYKTRKVAFLDDREQCETLYFPGFIKISVKR